LGAGWGTVVPGANVPRHTQGLENAAGACVAGKPLRHYLRGAGRNTPCSRKIDHCGILAHGQTGWANVGNFRRGKCKKRSPWAPGFAYRSWFTRNPHQIHAGPNRTMKQTHRGLAIEKEIPSMLPMVKESHSSWAGSITGRQNVHASGGKANMQNGPGCGAGVFQEGGRSPLVRAGRRIFDKTC